MNSRSRAQRERKHRMSESFEQWCILEIMGHNVFAGLLTEITIGGASFIRISIPETEGRPAFDKIFGASSVYCITPVTEEVAKARATSLRQEPISPWDLPEEWKQKFAAPALTHDDDIDDF